MRCDRMVGTLICYAGSASEASIGSRPLGSELVIDMVILCPKSQELPNLLRRSNALHQAKGFCP